MKKSKIAKQILPLIAVIIISIGIAIFAAFGCNGGCDCRGYDWFDTKYHFDRALIQLPGGEVKEIELAYWADAEGEQLTLNAKDGTRYLVSSFNCILIEDN